MLYAKRCNIGDAMIKECTDGSHTDAYNAGKENPFEKDLKCVAETQKKAKNMFVCVLYRLILYLHFSTHFRVRLYLVYSFLLAILLL